MRKSEAELRAILDATPFPTERKRPEEALRKSEKRFRELAELLPETVYETDIQGILTLHPKASARAPALGLATVYSVVKQNNGFIKAYSHHFATLDDSGFDGQGRSDP